MSASASKSSPLRTSFTTRKAQAMLLCRKNLRIGSAGVGPVHLRPGHHRPGDAFF